MKGMNLSVLHGFTKSLAMTVLSEVGDRTFCVAAVMTIISALIGWAAPNLISQKWAHHITTFFFFVFGIQSLWGGLTEDDEYILFPSVQEETFLNVHLLEHLRFLLLNSVLYLSEMIQDDDLKANTGKSRAASSAFSLTFFGEWGDKSQLATIGLAADENTLGVVLGGIMYVLSSC
ncbi:hypothetical protein Pint_18802 [Pistacia integerrima]|uniref:Uncharacterized protein n=1 Tax=Pistacia integerrima TaxID=434235 RepID=A0ACC0YXP2_9ROSI|nr:hypothetical protein Pint_18802 [Pistacia integerrima]